MMRRSTGSMLLEVSFATMLVAAALVGVAQLLVVASRQQRAMDFRRLAVCEACNVLEQVMAREFDDITPDKLRQLRLPEESEQSLPAVRLTIDVDDYQAMPPMRRVQVEIAWRNASGNDEQVQMAAWKCATTD